MPQCEMCGADKSSLTTTKVEGAELELCDSCTDFGTQVRQESSSTSTSKYSTSSSSGTSSGSSTSTGSSSGGSSRRRDMFDDMDEVATDYDERIRRARESEGLSREDLAKELNEKASLIGKLERGDMLPTDDVQRKLESKLGISLTEGVDVDDEEWSSSSEGGMTLGDVVKRKD